MGLAGEGFLGGGDLEDVLLKKKNTVVGYLHVPVFNIYTLCFIMDSETTISSWN